MFRLLINDDSREVLARVTAIMVAGAMGLTISACSSTEEAAQGGNAPIGIQTSQFSVTLENKAGLPLVDLEVAILAVDGLAYTHLVPRLENAEKRDLALTDFAGRDGTTFNLRVVRPKNVRVTGKDVTDKEYEVEVLWK